MLFLGIFLSLLLLETAMRLGGFLIVSIQDYQNAVAMRQKGTVRILCLGESTTQAGPEPYPEQLEKILNQRAKGVRFSVINKGLSGINTNYVLSNLEKNLSEVQPDIVIAMMGINDEGAHMPSEYQITKGPASTLQSLRTYKLIRWIMMAIDQKIKNSDAVYRRVSPGESPTSFKSKLQKEGGSQQIRYIAPETIRQDSETIFLDKNKSLELGRRYISQGQFAEAETIYRQLIRLYPRSYEAYERLAWFLSKDLKNQEAEEAYQKVIELNPNAVKGYMDLGLFYARTGRTRDAEEVYEKAAALFPHLIEPIFQLGWIYKTQNKKPEAVAQFRKVIHMFFRRENMESMTIKEKEIMSGRLAVLFKEIGDDDLARDYYDQANALRRDYYNPLTQNNYRKIKKILDDKNIKLICVQYPVRSAEPLKKIFEGEAEVVFVDNEKIFKDALRKSSYEEYFTDIFGGDFGHCTAKGNRLLAENIAHTILKEIFHQ
jgi:tetratricopeptide (TPR) repeat protein